MHGALVQLSYMYYHTDMNGEKDLWCSSTQKEGFCGALVQFGCCQQYYIAATNTDISECIKAPLLLGYM